MIKRVVKDRAAVRKQKLRDTKAKQTGLKTSNESYLKRLRDGLEMDNMGKICKMKQDNLTEIKRLERVKNQTSSVLQSEA